MNKTASLSVAVTSSELQGDSSDTNPPAIRLYRLRWLVLVILALLQIASSIMWITYPTVATITASYYNVSLNAVNWLTEVSYVSYVVTIFPGMWLLKAHGMLPVLYSVNLCAIIGSVIRLLGTFESVPHHYRFSLAMAGQIISSITFPLLMLLPTQISQNWFPDKQRILATSIASMATYVGGMLGVLLAPTLSPDQSHLHVLNEVFCGFTIFCGFAGFLVWHSKPPTPPYIVPYIETSESNTSVISFIKDLKTIATNRHATLLAIAGGGTFGVLPIIFISITEQLLCPAGYSNMFDGTFSAVLQGAGFVFSALIAFVLGKSKHYDGTVKVLSGVTISISLAITFVVRLENSQWIILFLGILLGITGCAAIPICMELSVETCYPINEGITGSVFWISVQLQAAIILPVMTSFGQPLSLSQFKHQTCTAGDSVKAFDLTYPMLGAIGFFTLETIVMYIWCRPTYKRMIAEELAFAKSPSIQIVQTIEQILPPTTACNSHPYSKKTINSNVFTRL